jgi:hypothetical protein
MKRYTRIGSLAAVLLLLVSLRLGPACLGAEANGSPAIIEPDGKPGATVELWLETSLKRIFPGSKPGSTNLHLIAARNSKIALQACFRNNRVPPLNVECNVLGAEELKPRVRFVGLVPMHHFTPHTELSELDGAGHLPGLVPDPLWPLTKVQVGSYESRSFWITLKVPADAKPGLREFTVRLSVNNGKRQVEFPVRLWVGDLVVQPRRGFPIIHWWRGEATWDYYKTGMFDERWYKITRMQLENMIEHGSDVIYVPMFFDRRETFKRPCQLLVVNEPQPGKYEFLKKEGILEDSYFHLSDEPGGGQHITNYKRARQILRELAPWMKVMDALSDIQYGRQGLTDIPIPLVSAAQAYIDERIPHWVYYCCAPQGPWLNRFMDTPLPKIRMSGMLFYRLGAQGFLHWGFNYWHKMEREEIGDPFNDASNASWPGIPYGDPFVIYPGADGRPMDSIRWEVFAESLQDYAILQTAGINRPIRCWRTSRPTRSFPRRKNGSKKRSRTFSRESLGRLNRPHSCIKGARGMHHRP